MDSPTRTALACAAALCLAACGSPAPTSDGKPLPRVLFDDQVVTRDADRPTSRFDGKGGSLLLGSGWHPPQVDALAAESFSYAWAVDGEAEIWWVPPEDAATTAFDLVGLCTPLAYPEAPPQQIEVWAGDHLLGSGEVAALGWQELRIPLERPAASSSSFKASSLEPMTLRFAYAVRPLDVLPGAEDRRRLSMACRVLAVVPQNQALRLDGALEASLDAPSPRASAHLKLAAGSKVSWPLPANQQVQIHFTDVDVPCTDCQLIVRRTSSQGSKVLFQGSASRAQDLRRAYGTGTVLSQLEFAFINFEAQDADAEVVHLQLGLGSDFLHSQPVPSRRDAIQPPHLFIYLIDTLRADHLDPYGQTHGLTPAIASFAEDAVTYRAWATSSWTLPSVVSVLTGVYPDRHGAQRGSTRFSPTATPPLARRLESLGYDRVAISQSLVASHRFNIDSGFDRFYFNDQLNGTSQRSQNMRRWLLLDLLHRPRQEQPLFAYLHGVAPHAPYVPQGLDRRFADRYPTPLEADQLSPHRFIQGNESEAQNIEHLRGLYQGEVAYADREFGHFIELLKYLDLYDHSLIMLLSDHGEEFYEHGAFDHGRTAYEEMLAVPLIVKYPAGSPGYDAAGSFIEQRVSLVDVAPTLLAVAGLDPLPVDLAGLVLPTDPGPRKARRLVFADINPAPARTLREVDYHALTLGTLKCIESLAPLDQLGRPVPNWQAFDLTDDPREQRPLAVDSPAVERCQNLMGQWWAAQQHAVTDADADDMPLATDAATLDKLRALGYID